MLEEQFGIQEYWVINRGWTPQEGSSISINTIIWTKELGLTAYSKRMEVTINCNDSPIVPYSQATINLLYARSHSTVSRVYAASLP